MGDWYTIGILVGIGAALGLAAVAFVRSLLPGAAIAVVAGVLIGLAFGQWDEALGGAVGSVGGAVGAAPLVGGALRRGGTRVGTAALLAAVAVVVAALAFVPVLGYLEALAAPALGLRLRRRAPERHAGLRSLAKD
jgi:hypothetical protein